MMVAKTSSVDETRQLAAAIGELCRPGDIFLLVGNLGTGKTAFAQGFARALGVTERVTSPTFTLVREYEGRMRIHHIDVYRLEQIEEVRDIGLFDMLDGASTALIEWGDAIVPALPTDYLEVRMAFGDDDDERQIELRPVGTRWMARQRVLATAIAPWQAESC